MTGTTTQCDTAAAVLSSVRGSRLVELQEQARQLRLATEWADLHPAESLHDAAGYPTGGFGESAVPVAGPGAPLVAEFCIAELAAALGLPTEVGRSLIGEALELRHRLPRLWQRVLAGDLPAWRARRVARETMALTEEAAAFVDRQVAHVAHRIGPAVLERLVDEAVARFLPAEAQARHEAAMEARCFVVDHRQVSFTGTSRVYGELDLVDALDLDAAVAAGAEQLRQLGSPESLDVRRSHAIAALARHELTLDLGGSARETMLYVHISADSLDAEQAVARVEHPNALVTTAQVRKWCGNPWARVTVKPVIDLSEHVHVGAYESPDRLREQTTLATHTCVFPWCTRPARRCDRDHVVPYGDGGSTCSCNLAPLCRRHHRLKTHGSWSYTAIEVGTYLWRSPHGYRFLRSFEGTTDVSDDRRGPPDTG